MRNNWSVRICFSVLAIGILFSFVLFAQEGSRNVNVRLPVTARAGEGTLEPGPYRIEIVEQAGGQALVKFRKPGAEEVLASVKAVLTPAPERAERNALKVLFREGSYYLDKLVISGEGSFFQFQP